VEVQEGPKNVNPGDDSAVSPQSMPYAVASSCGAPTTLSFVGTCPCGLLRDKHPLQSQCASAQIVLCCNYQWCQTVGLKTHNKVGYGAWED